MVESVWHQRGQNSHKHTLMANEPSLSSFMSHDPPHEGGARSWTETRPATSSRGSRDPGAHEEKRRTTRRPTGAR